MFKSHMSALDSSPNQTLSNNQIADATSPKRVGQDFLNQLTLGDFDDILFSETLTVRSTRNGEALGSFIIHAEKNEDEQGQVYFRVQAKCSGVIDGVDCGVNVDARIRPGNLQTITQEHTEHMRLRNFHYEKYTKIILESDCYRVIQRTSRPENAGNVSDRSMPLDEWQNFVGEGANVLLLRLLAKSQLNSQMEFTTLDGDAELRTVTYYPAGIVFESLGQSTPKLFKIGRKMQTATAKVDHWIFTFLPDARLCTWIHVGSPVYMRLDTESDTNSKAEPNTDSLSDLENCDRLSRQGEINAPTEIAAFSFLSSASVSDILRILQYDGDTNDVGHRENSFRKILSNIQEETEDALATSTNEDDTVLEEAPEPVAVFNDRKENDFEEPPSSDTAEDKNLHNQEEKKENPSEVGQSPRDCTLPPITPRPLSANSDQDAQKLVSRLNSILEAFADDENDDKQPFSARLDPNAYDEEPEDIDDPLPATADNLEDVKTDKANSVQSVETSNADKDDEKNADADSGSAFNRIPDSWAKDENRSIESHCDQNGHPEIAPPIGKSKTALTLETQMLMKSECEKYIGTHPELKSLLCQFVQAVLIAKPDDIAWFGATYFKIISEARKSPRKPKTDDHSDKDSALE